MQISEGNQYLGTEKISKLMIKFSVPCVLSLLINALYNIVDQIFIGNSELSVLGNAATGIAFPVFIIAAAFAWCYGDGCAAYLNICQGRRDADNAHKAIGTGIVITLFTSLALMLLLYPLKTSFLYLFGASENTLGYAAEYLDVVLAFFPAYILSNMMNIIVRADGSPGWSMASIVSGAVINIILDPIFIFAFKWGMAGAAWATVIGQTVSAVISIVYFFRAKTFRLTLKSFIPDFAAFGETLKLGFSTFIAQMTIVALALTSNTVLAKYGAASAYGADIPLAVIGIESKVFTIVINIVVGIVAGCQPIIGYNIGAKNNGRVKRLYRNVLLCTAIITLLFTLLFEFAPKTVVSLFGIPQGIDNPDAYWTFAEKTFRIFLSLVSFTCVTKMTSIFFQAAGKPLRSVVSSLMRDLVCYIPLAIVLPLFFGIDGILFAAPLADLIAMVVTVALTVNFMKELDAKNNSAEAEQSPSVIKPSSPGAIITVTREHGSSGKEIGRLAAEKLRIPFYCKELTALAAEESGLDKDFISDVTKNSPSVLYDLYLSTNVIRQAMAAQERIIRRIAENGSCVIVGRAADFVLRDNPNLIRVFVCANKRCRIERIKEKYGDDEQKAKRELERSDKARAAYYKSISGRNWGDKSNYDLTVDSSSGIDEAVNTIVAYVKGK